MNARRAWAAGLCVALLQAIQAAEPMPAQDRLEHWHDRLFLGVQDFITRLDSRFVAEGEIPLPVPPSPFRIGIESDFIRLADGATEVRPRLDLDLLLQLPNLERRLSVFVTSDTVAESPRLHAASSAIRAGLRLTPLRDLDLDVGLRADAPPVAFASLRWERNLAWGGWRLQPLAKLYLESGTGLGFAAGAGFDHWWDRWVLRAASYANWQHRSGDTEITQGITLAHASETLRFGRYSDMMGGRDLARGQGLQLTATGTHDTGAQRYEASLFVKQPTALPWLYWHVAPLLSWERAQRWHPDPGIRIGIDALFQDARAR